MHIPSPARGQKRKRSAEIDPSQSTPPSEPQWKRAGFRSAQEANTAFWDNLSKVPLCPPALREFDRRNSVAAGSTVQTAVRHTKRSTRSTARRAAQVDRLVRQCDTSLRSCAIELKRFARRGGPDLDHLRGCPVLGETSPAMPPKENSYRTPSNSTRSSSRTGRQTSAYNPGFGQHLIKHGVYPIGYEYMDDRETVIPDNWDEIQQRLARPRPSLSPFHFSEGAFTGYKRKVDRALDEADVIRHAFPILEGDTELPSAMKRTFQNLEPMTDGTIVDAEPDHYVGARPEQLDPRIREELNAYVIPSINQDAPILPNNFTEAKGPGGTWAVVKRQACYDGAIGARGMEHIQSYGESECSYDNNAYTITSSFDGEHLHMYTTHPTAPTKPGGRPEYHMHQLNAWCMTGNPETFRQGATAYRNARDWAKEKRDEFIEAANGRARALPEDSFNSSAYSDPSTSTQQAVAPESETSADTFRPDDEPVATRRSKRARKGRTR